MNQALIAVLFAQCVLGQGLTLVDAVVSRAPGGPAADAAFGPGDQVYLRFKVAGFQKQDTHQIFLDYSVQPVDAKGIPFEPTLEERLIAKTLRTESRILTYSFKLPPVPLSGAANFRIAVQDRIGAASLKTEVPFSVQSDFREVPADLTVAGFRYFRSEYDDTPLAEPVFQPAETVWCRFVVSGFSRGENNRYNLSYGVSLRTKAGKILFSEPKAISDSRDSFYPKLNVPAAISVRLESTIRPGDHTIVIQARDEQTGKSKEAEFPIRVR